MIYESILKKGTEVYLSDIGHYNFFYPNRVKKVILENDTPAAKRSFLAGESEGNPSEMLTAYVIGDIVSKSKGNIIVWTKTKRRR